MHLLKWWWIFYVDKGFRAPWADVNKSRAYDIYPRIKHWWALWLFKRAKHDMVFTLGSDRRVSQRRRLPALKRWITLQGKKARVDPEVVAAVRLIYVSLAAFKGTVQNKTKILSFKPIQLTLLFGTLIQDLFMTHLMSPKSDKNDCECIVEWQKNFLPLPKKYSMSVPQCIYTVKFQTSDCRYNNTTNNTTDRSFIMQFYKNIRKKQGITKVLTAFLISW